MATPFSGLAHWLVEGLAQLAARRGAGGILCFHGIALRSMPSSALVSIDVPLLDALLDVCSAVGEVVPLRELVSRHRDGRRTGGLIALTFDDAYASLRSDLPGASSRLTSLPRTLFATTGSPGGAFWWDRLDDLHPRVPRDRWREFEDTVGLPEEFRRGQPAELGELRPLRQWLLARHHGRLPGPVADRLTELEDQVGFRTAQRAMTEQELATAAADPLVDVGVHTVTHPVLPLLPDDELVQEISACLGRLRAVVDSPVPILAIPYGLFDERTAGLASSAGVESTLCLEPRTLLGVDGAANPLPRFCLTHREPGWKLAIKLGGFRDRLVPPSEGPPELPSERA